MQVDWIVFTNSTSMKRFLTGLATGWAIGHLIAPRSGKETRDQLTDAVNQRINAVKDQWGKTTSLVIRLADDVKTQSGIIKDDLTVFADITAERLDQYKNEFGQTNSGATTPASDAANAIRLGAAETEYALKQ